MPWWSNNLCSLRSKARTCFKAWSKKRKLPNKFAYRGSKVAYQKALRLSETGIKMAATIHSSMDADFTARLQQGSTDEVKLDLPRQVSTKETKEIGTESLRQRLVILII
jgi:hypothetical protein